MSHDHAARARALVGCRFRSQGREPLFGLDCIGVVVASYGIATDLVPRDYRLRGPHHARIRSGLLEFFRRISPRLARSGDLLLMTVAVDQVHLAVRTDVGFVHADVRLGRVVETPGCPPWPVNATYRWRMRRKRGG